MYEKRIDKHLYVRVIRYALNADQGFSVPELYSDKKAFLTDHEKEVLQIYFEFAYSNARQVSTYGASGNSEGFFILAHKGPGWNHENTRYEISSDTLFKYLDLQELKLARKTSKEAKDLSWKAIYISIGAVLVSIFIPLFIAQFFTQTVRLEDEQLQTLELKLTCPHLM